MSEKYVLVTGASTGIGEAAALHLDGLGWRVFAGVRREQDGERLVAAAGRLQPIILDVTSPEDIQLAAKHIDVETGGRLHGLVNNAGVVVAGPLELLPLDRIRMQLEVNVIGQIAVTQAVLPSIRAARGRVVNIGSIAGKFAAAYSGPYAASKFAIEAITDSLRVELSPWGIHVSVVEPGNIKTPIWDKGIAEGADLMASLEPNVMEAMGRLYSAEVQAMFDWAEKMKSAGVPALKVAKAIEHALTSPRPKTRYLVGPDARVQSVIARVVPDRLQDRLIFKLLGTPRKKTG